MLQIRAHHLFCTALFEGCGYDESFSREMERILQCLQMKPEMRIRLCCGEADPLCLHCPNHTPDGGCRLGTENVRMRDQILLQAFSLHPGRYRYAELRARLKTGTKADFEAVCGGCRWKEAGFCSFSKLQKALQ
ncbi:DUF1284 domain-containing protein [Yeguia hominis]|uniref:DUF1284 domain-containing protein n=1 Tax=Yeguia hominis TaxID=2763662 RepID=A0A926HNN6_9FIRM|nr:DUF1284 domain-containing protein [Yeguia hominis]MBC8534392.1 DUF1284 domain-containing protein [Yeguia hominis]